MSGYEKVSFLKFEAAGQSWHVTGWFNSVGGPEHSWVDVERAYGDRDGGRVCVESGRWIRDGYTMYPEEKSAIVEYLRANHLPGETE